MMRHAPDHRDLMAHLPVPGFSLIELLVSTVIIAVLVGTLLPALGSARDMARKSVCLSNHHALGAAGTLYTNDHRYAFWEYVHGNGPDSGAYWWFGFEPGGPGTGTDRPLDLERSVFADYLSEAGDRFQCPSFPYTDPAFNRKFAKRAATYGYNWRLSGVRPPPALELPEASIPPQRIDRYAGRSSSVFMFADSLFTEVSSKFEEGYYIAYSSNPSVVGGYAHFRHRSKANVVYLDGHASDQKLTGGSHRTVAGGQSGNLTAPDGTNAIYGDR